jgi:hypothetical protein
MLSALHPMMEKDPVSETLFYRPYLTQSKLFNVTVGVHGLVCYVRAYQIRGEFPVQLERFHCLQF